MLDKNPETRIGVSDIKVGDERPCPARAKVCIPFWTDLPWGLCVGLGFGISELRIPSRSMLGMLGDLSWLMSDPFLGSDPG